MAKKFTCSCPEHESETYQSGEIVVATSPWDAAESYIYKREWDDVEFPVAAGRSEAVVRVVDESGDISNWTVRGIRAYEAVPA